MRRSPALGNWDSTYTSRAASSQQSGRESPWQRRAQVSGVQTLVKSTDFSQE